VFQPHLLDVRARIDSFPPAQRYLKWLSIDAEVFNVGNYRRNDTPQPTADFFDKSNVEGERMRRAAAEAAINDMIKWFKRGGIIAIFDATNSTKDRRRWIKERCDREGIETLFVESKCDDEDLIMSNILEVKTTSPDYAGQDPDVAAQDFRNRIRNYEKVYQTIDQDESDLTYLKIMDVGKQVIINRIQDYLQSRVVYYLMNLHIKPRSIWLSRVSQFLCCERNYIDLSSMVNQWRTSWAQLVVTQISLQTARSMLESFQSWSDNPLR
jgi:6-phosphofructo-2-kinase/fructose-2,6-biphosphatase 2